MSKTDTTTKAVGDAADTAASKAGDAIASTQKAVHSAVDPEPVSIVDDAAKLTNDAAGAVVSTSQTAFDKVAGTGDKK
jgi:hypothetical protein